MHNNSVYNFKRSKVMQMLCRRAAHIYILYTLLLRTCRPFHYLVHTNGEDMLQAHQVVWHVRRQVHVMVKKRTRYLLLLYYTHQVCGDV